MQNIPDPTRFDLNNHPNADAAFDRFATDIGYCAPPDAAPEPEAELDEFDEAFEGSRSSSSG